MKILLTAELFATFCFKILFGPPGAGKVRWMEWNIKMGIEKNQLNISHMMFTFDHGILDYEGHPWPKD